LVKTYKIIIALFLLSLVAMGVTCEEKYRQGYDERIDVRAEYGEPEDVYTYSSDDYWSESWWYWSKGIEFDFEKRERSKHGDLGCVKTIYTDIVIESNYEFPPITSIEKRAELKEEFEREKLKRR